jgi:hypothetical protein
MEKRRIDKQRLVSSAEKFCHDLQSTVPVDHRHLVPKAWSRRIRAVFAAKLAWLDLSNGWKIRRLTLEKN